MEIRLKSISNLKLGFCCHSLKAVCILTLSISPKQRHKIISMQKVYSDAY